MLPLTRAFASANQNEKKHSLNMPDAYKPVFLILSTVYGPLEVGMRLERKNLKTKIAYALCMERKVVDGASTTEEFIKHLSRKHPELRNIIPRKNYCAQMVV